MKNSILKTFIYCLCSSPISILLASYPTPYRGERIAQETPLQIIAKGKLLELDPFLGETKANQQTIIDKIKALDPDPAKNAVREYLMPSSQTLGQPHEYLIGDEETAAEDVYRRRAIEHFNKDVLPSIRNKYSPSSHLYGSRDREISKARQNYERELEDTISIMRLKNRAITVPAALQHQEQRIKSGQALSQSAPKDLSKFTLSIEEEADKGEGEKSNKQSKDEELDVHWSDRNALQCVYKKEIDEKNKHIVIDAEDKPETGKKIIDLNENITNAEIDQLYEDACLRKQKAFSSLMALVDENNHLAESFMSLLNFYNFPKGFKQDASQAHLYAQRSLNWLKEESAKGNYYAQTNLAVYYFYSMEVEKNEQEAVRLYSLAAEQGYARAQFSLGVLHIDGVDGTSVLKDELKAIKLMRRAANQKYHVAQYYLGLMYETLGFIQNKEVAIKWYQLAAEQGNIDAQISLGRNYAKGTESEKNEELACYWWKQAADANNAEAQIYLGDMYANGKGVNKNKQEAFRLYYLAAEQGNLRAHHHIGDAYRNGHGVIKDEYEAAKWYQHAANEGYLPSQSQLALWYKYGIGVPKNETKALYWEHLAAEEGYKLSQTRLALRYYHGEGVNKNVQEAVKWFRRAADQRDEEAQWWLGCLYMSGESVQKNVQEAIKLFKKAAISGYNEAQFSLGWLYESEPLFKSEEESLKWYELAAANGHQASQFKCGVFYYKNKNGLEAVKWFRCVIDHEKSDGLQQLAQEFLGRLYACDVGSPRNDGEAYATYKVAAEGGDLRAQYILGMMYAYGQQIPQDTLRAVRFLQAAANQGHTEAEIVLNILLSKM